MKRYRTTLSRIHENSWNVVDVSRRNEFGDVWVEYVAVTRREAIMLADKLNRADATA